MSIPPSASARVIEQALAERDREEAEKDRDEPRGDNRDRERGGEIKQKERRGKGEMEREQNRTGTLSPRRGRGRAGLPPRFGTKGPLGRAPVKLGAESGARPCLASQASLASCKVSEDILLFGRFLRDPKKINEQIRVLFYDYLLTAEPRLRHQWGHNEGPPFAPRPRPKPRSLENARLSMNPMIDWGDPPTRMQDQPLQTKEVW